MENPGISSAQTSHQGLVSSAVQKIGPLTALAVLLLLVSTSIVAYGLTLVVRGLTPGFALYIATLGLLAGWLMARSRLSARRSGILAALSGLSLLCVHLGNLEATLFSIVMRANNLALAFFQGPRGISFLLEGARALALVSRQLVEQLGVLLSRLVGYFAALISGNAAFDPLAILILWGAALWATAAWAAWGVRRVEKPLAALLPGGALLSASLSYSRDDAMILLAYLGAALLLILLIEHQSRQRGWEASRTDYSEELGLDIAMLAVPLLAMLLAAAAFSPNISPRSITEFVQEALRQQDVHIGELGDSLGLRRAPPAEDRFEHLRRPGMPRQHLIGSGPELSEQVTMEVRTLEVEGLEEGHELSRERRTPFNYWRRFTYDIYTGSGWATSSHEAVSYNPGELAQPPGWRSDSILALALPNQLLLSQEIQILNHSSEALYAVGHVLTADANYHLAWRPSSEQAGADVFGGSVESSHYTVRSLVSVPVEDLLADAGSVYPQELRDHYLALPGSIPQRVHALAVELTATQPTPYERARAIEQYLRSVPYSTDVPLPPPDADAIDYYLFELQRGYCDYAASAMVVLARAAGIPARLVIGYAGGGYDPTQDVTIVSEAEAHSWPELYFPGSGWIEFEPTGGRPDIVYGLQAIPSTVPDLESLTFPTPRKQPIAWLAWLILGPLLALLVLFLAGWLIVDRWRLHKMAPERAVMLVYERFYQNGAQLIPSSTLAQTPNEFGTRFTTWMNRLSASNQWGKRLAIGHPEVNRLTELYNLAVYSPYPPGSSEQALAIHAWNRMAWRLWLLRLSPRPKRQQVVG
jgi:transglutaminase-like putative cysteine protease